MIWLVLCVFIISVILMNTTDIVSTPMVWLVFFVLIIGGMVMMNLYIP